MTEVQTTRKWLSDALLIAILPACLYTMAFAHQASFAAAFGVPLQFVAVTWNDAFYAVVTAFAIVQLLAIPTFLYSSFRSWRAANPSYQLTANLLPGVVGAAELIYLFWVNRHGILLVLLAVGLVGIIMGIFTAREHRKHRAVDAPGAARVETVVMLILWAYVMFGTPLVAGDAQARVQKDFYVVQTLPDTVVLGVWGDTLVTAPFDRNTRIVRRVFTVTKVSEHSPLAIRDENVGPLRIEELP
jgi:hypothetical protein